MRDAIPKNRTFMIADLVVLLLIGALIYSVVTVSQEWRAEYNPVTQIDLSGAALLRYAFLSGSRGMVAYLLSLLFTLVVGYIAAKSRAAERVILPALDILQSVPVVGFMPGVVLTLIATFPGSQFGLELAAVMNVFFGQVWNMTFSFYSSLKAVPVDLVEASGVMHLGAWERFKKLELPVAAVPLAWNSLLSMAGGWFFLSLCEAFTLGQQEFRLPGLGSYMALAISSSDGIAILKGATAMILLIISMDFVIWRPIMAWVQRFRVDTTSIEVDTSEPLMTFVFRDAQILLGLRKFYRRAFVLVKAALRIMRRQVLRLASWIHPRKRRSPAGSGSSNLHSHSMGQRGSENEAKGIPLAERDPGLGLSRDSMVDFNRIVRLLKSPLASRVFVYAIYGMVAVGAVWGGAKLAGLLSQVTAVQFWLLIRNGTWTLLRVLVAVIFGTIWTVPAGIWIATHPTRLRIAQPLVQIAASFPAPMLYPLVILSTEKLGIPFSVGSVVLLMLGVQWYILFNVLAGALRIPQELRFTMDLMGSSRWDRWRVLYLPSIFPALVTGWVTAAGGAWNASIVAEAMTVRGESYSTAGLGAMIMESSGKGDGVGFAAALTLMVAIVLLFNSLVWTRVYRLAQSRYRMDAY